MKAPESLHQIARFWLPLQATWLMMAVEGPFLAAVIARLPDPKFNLAAYGVAFALAIIVEAPVIMIMSAATALVDGAENYRRLRNFTWFMNGGITVAMVVLIWDPVWRFVALDAIRLDPEVARLARTALVILLPWPAAIGYRRFCQGILIRAGLTRRVAWGTAIRLTAMSATAVVAWRGFDLPGAWVGAWALSVAVVAEAVASRVMAAGPIRRVLATPSSAALSYGEIHYFYLPLALTSTISLAVQPMVTFFMGQARFSLESLAVLPVINSLVFVFRTPGLSYQEVTIAVLDRGWENLRQVRRFAALLGFAATAGFALIALTPLSTVWLERVSGLTPELADHARLPLRILVLMPAMSVLLSLQRSLLVARRATGPITWASVLEVTGILVVLYLTVVVGGWVGATAAAAAYMAGRAAANLFLMKGMSAGV